MAPLQSMSDYEDGHLLYKDVMGNPHVYKYEMGKAICFGSGFEHATQASTNDDVKVI